MQTVSPDAALAPVPTDEEVAAAEGLCDFVAASPTAFHAVATMRARLDEAGFRFLPEGEAWDVAPGSRCYTVRNNSSLVAFKVGERVAAGATADGGAAHHFQVLAAHGDSPALRLKAAGELVGPEGYLRLDAEPYGGMLDHTWFDRPLTLAGRVMVREGSRVGSRLVRLDDVALIPSVAIHLDRSQNERFSPDRARDLVPVASAGTLGAGGLAALVAEAAGAAPADVLARDLFLVGGDRPRVWGPAREFVSGPRLDDLMCAHVSLEAFLAAENPGAVLACCCFDNEEVGSNTKQGAMSTLLAEALARVSGCLGASVDDHRRALSRSMLVSCDNAHAVHPNRPELHDPANRCRLNGGIVVKEAANQHYCTDAFSRAVLVAVLDAAGVPHQGFANRSDMAGGSTLGNLSNIQASMHAVDVGCPQLAMHSVCETAGVRDVTLARRALGAFLAADIRIDGADGAELG